MTEGLAVKWEDPFKARWTSLCGCIPVTRDISCSSLQSFSQSFFFFFYLFGSISRQPCRRPRSSFWFWRTSSAGSLCLAGVTLTPTTPPPERCTAKCLTVARRRWDIQYYFIFYHAARSILCFLCRNFCWEWKQVHGTVSFAVTALQLHIRNALMLRLCWSKSEISVGLHKVCERLCCSSLLLHLTCVSHMLQLLKLFCNRIKVDSSHPLNLLSWTLRILQGCCARLYVIRSLPLILFCTKSLHSFMAWRKAPLLFTESTSQVIIKHGQSRVNKPSYFVLNSGGIYYLGPKRSHYSCCVL